MTGKSLYWIECVLTIYAICAIKTGDGACNWPSVFASTTWQDSTQDDVTFSVTTLTGFDVSVSSSASVSNWECVTASSFNTDGRLVMQSVNTVSLFSVHYYVYVCLTLTSITDVSYRYYINNNKQENANNVRVFLYPVETLTDTGTICDDVNGATGAEYHVIIKSGEDTSAKIGCPWSFLGRYGYTHTTAANVVTCNAQTSQLDTCTTSTEMRFDYSVCTTKVAYSVSDTVWCVDNVEVSGTNYVMLYNGNDANTNVDNVSVFRFTCMAISADGNQASISPRHCQTGQTADQFPVSGSTQIGARLTVGDPSVTCPTCPNLSNPDRGSVSIATSGASTTATYTCSSNYTMHGSSSRTCQNSGSWTSSAPYCSCATPSAPSNGDVTINSQGTLVQYTCDVGFSLFGTSGRACQLDSATWSNSGPTCNQCATIPGATGRSYTTTTDGITTTAKFSCSSGYLLSGAISVTCSSVGTWTSTLPTCVSCQVLTNPSSGLVTITTDGVTSTATYSCFSGYTLVGSSTRLCRTDGTYTGSSPFCTCTSPSSPSHGAVVTSGNTATYTCNVNYTLSGDAVRTCQSDGTGWSGSDPSCTACATLSGVSGGAVTLASSGTATTAKFTCSTGSTIDGASSLTCQADGTWNNAIPQCVLCPSITDPASGSVTVSTSGTVSTATYACASGYEINGNTIRLCSVSGTWTLTAPTCSCLDPPSISNGFVTSNGVTATYTCFSGFSLNGASVRTCANTGSGWSDSAPFCVTCATLTTPTGGSVTSSTDGTSTQASFTCNTGYTLNGEAVITCGSQGTWSASQPTCAKCPDLADPSSGSVSMVTNGTVSTATYSCASGYYISGAISLTCRTDATWDNSPPACKCNFPATPANGGVSVSDSSSGTVATYTCNTGHSISGMYQRTCLTDGSGWESTDPSCTVCETVTAPSSGAFSLTSNGTATSAIFTCDVGGSLNGVMTLDCLPNGTYDSEAPTCVSCPSLSDPQSGSVAMTTDGSMTTATFTCVSGYYLSSSGVLTCTTSGTWDTTAPSCICNAPPTVANGNSVLAANQSTVTYTCDSGYVLTGSQVRHCLTNGNGWSGTAPICDSGSLNTGASTGGDEDLAVPLGVVIVMAILLAILLAVVVVVTYLYVTLRKRNKRIGSAEHRRPPAPDTKPVEEENKNFSAIPNSSFGTSPSMSPTVTPLPPKDVALDRNVSRLGRRKTPRGGSIPRAGSTSTSRTTATATDVKLSNGLTPIPFPENKNLPASPRKLAPIEHEPPKGTDSSPRRRSKRKHESRHQNKQKERSEKPQRLQSPVKMGTRTPELLSNLEFNYIEPVYCYESEPPLPAIGSHDTPSTGSQPHTDIHTVGINSTPTKQQATDRKQIVL